MYLATELRVLHLGYRWQVFSEDWNLMYKYIFPKVEILMRCKYYVVIQYYNNKL